MLKIILQYCWVFIVQSWIDVSAELDRCHELKQFEVKVGKISLVMLNGSRLGSLVIKRATGGL